MEYRQKMVVPSSQKYKHEEDDDEDLEALRLAALKSLKAKTSGTNIKTSVIQPTISQTHSPFTPYNHQRIGSGTREYYHPNRPFRPNGNHYHPSRHNLNLIEIIPLEENENPLQDDNKIILESDSLSNDTQDESKFHRYDDNVSGSDDDDTRGTKDLPDSKVKNKTEDDINDDVGTDKENHSGVEENSPCAEETECVPEEDEEEEEEDEDKDDDDDDVLLMADLEEEDSLERLMDEMEREMTEDKPVTEKKEKKCSKRETNKECKKAHESIKSRRTKSRERTNEKMENASTGLYKNDQRSVSPHSTNRLGNKHRSVSPKLKSRKKSPRRSPISRRSPSNISRQVKKSQRELRLRSPRKSPPKYSPRPRSPKLSPRLKSPRLSPRKSPARSPIRRSPQRKSSPRARSRSRSPLLRRRSRSRSPRVVRTRSPRNSPSRSRSPFPRSPVPLVSFHRLSPKRLLSRSRSPKLSPRRTSPVISRTRSPKLSPTRRISPRNLSPSRISPHKSPWSSPRNSPRLSPRRRHSPKEVSKKNRVRSITPEEITDVVSHKRENTPIRHNIASPELSRTKTKLSSLNKETVEIMKNPVLEARRRKFESTRPIDPIHDNKKIKLSRHETISKTKSLGITQNTQEINIPKRSTRETTAENLELPDAELCLHDDNYDFDDLEEHTGNESPLRNSVPINVVESPVEKVEKKRVKKKKKKDKELYQVGKLKGSELPLSERIGKEKCKKRKDILTDNTKKEVDTVVDGSVDEEADLRTELSRRRAERLNRTAHIQSARLLQSAFKGVVNEAVKNNAKVTQRHLTKCDEKSNSKEIRRVTVLHRAMPDLDHSEDETIDSKVPVRFRLGMNKPAQETRESKASRKSSKHQGRKGTKKNTH